MLSKITDYFANKKLKKEQLTELESLLRDIVADGIVTEDEKMMLRRFDERSLLTPEESSQIRSRVFTQVLSSYLADRRLDRNERASLQNLAANLDIPSTTLSEVDSQINYHTLLETIETVPFGQLPHNSGASGVILQKGERDLFCHSANLLEQRVVRSHYAGGSRGVSIRIMKGVSYRVGQTRGTIQSETGWVTVSFGDFVITDKRLIFKGDRKSINAPLAKILDVEMLADGVRFSMTTRQKPATIQFFTPKSTELAGLLLSRVLNQ